MWEDGGSKGFEPGTNGGICPNCSMRSRWWSEQAGETPKKSRFYFWKRKLLARSCRIPQSTRPPLTGSKWLPSSQHSFEGIARKIKRRRKSDTSPLDTKEGGKKWDLGCPASGTTRPWLGKGKRAAGWSQDSRGAVVGKEDCALMEPAP